MLHQPARSVSKSIRTIVFAATLSVLLLLSGWYASQQGARANDQGGRNTVPPYQDLSYQAIPNTDLEPGDLVTHTITFLREARNYSVTLSFTNSVPALLAVVPSSLHASEGNQPQVQGDLVSWRSHYEPGALTTTVTISYVTTVGDCNPAAVTAGSKPWLAATQPVTNVVWLQELTNDIVTTPGAPETDAATVNLTLPPCGVVYAPVIQHYPPPPFPTVLDGNFTITSATGPWTQLVNGSPGGLIYPNAELPKVVQRTNGPNVAWLGGTKNSTNTLRQGIVPTAPYFVTLRFQYYTASEEDDCQADTAGVYLGSTQVLPIKLCNGSETNKWAPARVALPPVANAADLSFVTVLNGARNSNWFVSNVELCSDAANVPPGTPKCTK